MDKKVVISIAAVAVIVVAAAAVYLVVDDEDEPTVLYSWTEVGSASWGESLHCHCSVIDHSPSNRVLVKVTVRCISGTYNLNCYDWGAFLGDYRHGGFNHCCASGSGVSHTMNAGDKITFWAIGGLYGEGDLYVGPSDGASSAIYICTNK